MAAETKTLIIDAHDPSLGTKVRDVIAVLTDGDGNEVPGHDADGVIVAPVAVETDSDGHLALELIPNADLTDPANTCYTICAGSKRFLIVKDGNDGQTLHDALVDTPAALGPLVHGVKAGGTPGQVYTKASGDDYDAEWDDPTGGEASDADDVTYDPAVPADWQTLSGLTPDQVALALDIEMALIKGLTETVEGFGDDFVVDTDPRLSDARTPTAHATSHQDGGLDELALDASQITSGTFDDARLPATITRDTELADLVTGPASATNLRVAVYNGTTGKIIADGGVTVSDLVLASNLTESVQDVVGALTGFGDAGLTFTYSDGGNTVTLAVNVDGSTIEISSDSLRIKDAGVTMAKISATGTANSSSFLRGDGTWTKSTRIVVLEIGDSTTVLTTGDGKRYWQVPDELDGWKLTRVYAGVTTQSSSGLPTFQIDNNGADVLSTKLTIDANESFSSTAATAAVVNTSNNTLAKNTWVRLDCDVAGTGAQGAKVGLVVQAP